MLRESKMYEPEKSNKGIDLLYELCKTESISCPEKVKRFNSHKYCNLNKWNYG